MKKYKIVAPIVTVILGAALMIGGSVVPASADGGDDCRNQSIRGENSCPKPTHTPSSSDLGGSTLTAGDYEFGSAIRVTSSMYFDAEGDCNAVFVIHGNAAMNTTAGITMHLLNGSKARNIYWNIDAAITAGARSHLVGIFNSNAAITIGASSYVDGSLTARTTVSLGDDVVVVAPDTTPCPTPTPTGTPTPTVSPTVSPTPTITPTASPTATPSPTVTPTPTVSPTPTPSPTYVWVANMNGDWLQQFGRKIDDKCPAGWGPSWAEWPNEHTGGYVCTRTIPRYGH